MKALSLLSGGLDSQLAVCVIMDQGIEVEAINFTTPFYGGGDKIAEAARNLGVTLTTFDIGEEYMEVLRNPRYGYGKNFNPCIDCHAFMIRKTAEYMKEAGASFIITGEVLGQRPMSQNRTSLDVVERLSGYPGLVLRPLSAKLLPPTIPEQEGWVDRERLLDIKGRSRQVQMELAKHYEIHDYPSPAGGCLLTVESFASRLQRLFELRPQATADETEILKVGRLFLLPDKGLLVVGRKQAENEKIEKLAGEQDYLFKVAADPGPTSLLRSYGSLTQEDLDWAASITARYSDAVDKPTAPVKVWQPGDSETLVDAVPFTRENTPKSI